MNLIVPALTSFTASGVEAVEAATIVLAVGTASSWKNALGGTCAASAVLICGAALLGPALGAFVPIAVLKFVIGVFLLFFGTRWLRKAILRAAGRKSPHDENAIYNAEVAQLANASAVRRDRIAFMTAFNGVLLEGLEVAIIVVTLGASGSSTLIAAGAGAIAAGALVAGIAVAVRKPLARVPENSLKFAVGIMLTTFGIFWTGESLGVAWPGGDIAVAYLAAAGFSLSAIAVTALRRR